MSEKKEESREMRTLLAIRRAFGNDPGLDKLVTLARSLEAFGIKFSIGIEIHPKK